MIPDLFWKPSWAWAAFSDPIRRIHLLVQTVLVLGPAWGFSGSWRAGVYTTASYFLLYEFLLEPISKWLVSKGYPSLVGPYWERGPQDGERYTHE